MITLPLLGTHAGGTQRGTNSEQDEWNITEGDMSLIESLLVVIFTSPPLFPLLAHNAKRERKAEVIELQHGTRELPSWTAVVDKNPQKKRKRERSFG